MVARATPFDFEVVNEGTVVRFTPLHEAARAWVDEHVASEPWQWLGQTLVVDHRYADDLLQGILAEGFRVTGL